VGKRVFVAVNGFFKRFLSSPIFQ